MQNVGFIRVDIRGNLVNMEIHIRKLRMGDENGSIFAFVMRDELRSLNLGEIQVLDGIGEASLQLPVKEIQDVDVSIEDIIGIGIRFEKDSYMASCWLDDYAKQIAEGAYIQWNKSQPHIEEVHTLETDMEVAQKQQEDIEEVAKCQEQTAELQSVESAACEENLQMPAQHCYRKLELTQMHMLPPQERHYRSNAFLVHGFWNYGYVVLKTDSKGGKKKISLGVPGVYERPEAAMALAFGFPRFEALPKEVAQAPLNVELCFSHEEWEAYHLYQIHAVAESAIKNQPSKDRIFGCWFVDLHI